MTDPNEIQYSPADQEAIAEVPSYGLSRLHTQSFELDDNSEKSRLRRISTTAISGALAVGAAASYAFEIGPWNEALRIDKGLEVLQRTQNALAVGGAVMALTAVIEIVPSVLVALGLNRDKGVMKKFNGYLQRKNDASIAEKEAKLQAKLDKIDESTPNRIDRIKLKTDLVTTPLAKIAHKGADVITAFGGGAAVLVTKRHFADPQPNIKKGLKDAATGTAWVSLLGGSVGYLIAGGINTVSKTGIAPLEKAADLVVEYGSDKKFWLTALGVGYAGVGISKGVKKINKVIKNKNNQKLNESQVSAV